MAGAATVSATVRAVSAVLIAMTVLACGGGAPSAPAATGAGGATSQASPAGSPSASDGPGSPSSGLCALFTPAELAPFLGAEPAPGSVGGPLDSSCEWDAGEPFLMIQKVPADYFEDVRGAEGYRELDGIGEYAFVAAHAFGRIASAMTADAAYVVIASEGTDEAGQIDILRRFIDLSPGAPALATPDVPPATDPPTSGSGNTADCAVATEEISEAAGIEMVQTYGCSWTAADTGTLFDVLLMDVPTSLFELLQGAEPVTGVGDEAYTDETGALYVRVGDRAVSINVFTLSLNEDEALDVAVAIARHAVEGLR